MILSGTCLRSVLPKLIQDECYTALRIASKRGHTKVVMTLINEGANVNYEAKVTIVHVLLTSYQLEMKFSHLSK